MEFVGQRKRNGKRERKRIWMEIECLEGIYGVMDGKIVYLGMIGGVDKDEEGKFVKKIE